jgi:hypothetical protein
MKINVKEMKMGCSFRKLMFIVSISIIGSVNVKAAENVQGTLLISPDSSVGVPITGVIDTVAKTISISGFVYQGFPFSVVSGEYLEPGTYYRTNVSNGISFFRWTQIPAGKVGGYFVMSWKGETFAVFMQWDYQLLPDTYTYTNIPFFGNSIKQGPLTGNDLTIDFGASEEIIFLNSQVSVNDGFYHECTSLAGATVSFNVTATMNDGATIERVDWVFDGAALPETGIDASVLASLGSHTVEAAVTTSLGATDTTSATFTVRDSTGPALDVFFVDDLGQIVTSAALGDVEIRFNAEDVCDPSPIVSRGAASPIMNVVSGDLIKIVQLDGNVIIPTTGVRVTAIVRDASGNSRSASNTLLIE